MTNIEALKEVYTSLGGELTDTYPSIADGAPVSDYVIIPDVISAISVKATGAIELPTTTAEDNGKLLTVVNGVWNKAAASSSLPAVTADDNGDVLTVVEGTWSKAALPDDKVVIFNSSGIANLSTDSTVTLSGSTLLDVKNALIAGKIPIIHVGGTAPTASNAFFLYPSLVYDGGSNYLHFRAIVMIDGHEYIAKTSFNITTSSPGNTLSVSTKRIALYSDIPTT